MSIAYIYPELFDSMSFETRMVPSIKNAKANYLLAAKDDNEIVAYVYCNIPSKETYSNNFATFFELGSVKSDKVGCL